MDYEKEYKGALERAKKLYERGTITESLSYVFPELKESEDERIKKRIIALVNAHGQGRYKEEMLAWLEKQDKIVDYYEDRLDECACKYFNKGYKHALEKQGEPTDINPSEFDLRLNKLLKQFETLPKEELASSLSFYLNVVQNDGTYREEKQGGVPVTINIDKMVEDYANNEECDNEGFGKPVNCMIRAYRQGLTDAIVILNLRKQGEQNLIMAKSPQLGGQRSTDKIELRFKVGDWVVENGVNGNPVQITSFEEDKGVGVKVWFSNGTGTWVDYLKGYHKWTIEDAKEGDVLFMDNGASNCIFIYKSFNNGIINKYASYNKFGFESEHYLVLNDGYVIPATKEQRDTLIKAMSDAGYTFDFEKKELNKNSKSFADGGCKAKIEVEQNPAWSEEDENEVAILESYIRSGEWSESHIDRALGIVDELVNKCKSSKDKVQPNQEWNGADNVRSTSTMQVLEYAKSIPDYNQFGIDDINKNINWIKSLKERVQPKQEWSEEDEKIFNGIILRCKKYGHQEQIDWLKSLKQRYTWKPNDEQIDVLEQFISEYKDIDDNFRAYPISHNIESLYNDLKKLTE